MQIRLAGEHDLESLVDLWIELMDYHASYGPGFLIDKNKRAAIETFIRDMLSKKLTRIFVMEASGKVVAMLVARLEIRPEMFVHQKAGYIAETMVTASYKGKNIGSELTNAALAWFDSENAAYAELMVASANDAAFRFWESKGFKTHLLRMIRRHESD